MSGAKKTPPTLNGNYGGAYSTWSKNARYYAKYFGAQDVFVPRPAQYAPVGNLDLDETTLIDETTLSSNQQVDQRVVLSKSMFPTGTYWAGLDTKNVLDTKVFCNKHRASSLHVE